MSVRLGKVEQQPFATLVALGVKTIITADFDPFDPKRKHHFVRGERNHLAIVASAQRPKVVATEYGGWWTWGERGVGKQRPYTLVAPDGGTTELPFGKVVCTVVVDDALPIVRPQWEGLALPPRLKIYEERPPWESKKRTVMWSVDGVRGRNFTDQLPLGDFTPGRWGWLLSDPQPPRAWCPGSGRRMAAHNSTPRYSCAVCGQRYLALAPGDATAPDHRVPCDPIPCKGRQGVFELPADVAEALSRGEAS